MTKLLLFMLLLPQLTFADSFQIMSWNVFMLPKPAKNSDQKNRSHAIAEYLKSNTPADIILMQEAFSGRLRDILQEELKSEYPYIVRLKKKTGIYPIIGPGLLALSKYPMSPVDHVYFDKCKKADCHASKGAQLLEVELPTGKKIQIVNTHLQSGRGEKESDIRISQTAQIKNLIDKNKKTDVPYFVVGDFNIDAYTDNYFQTFKSSLDLYDYANPEARSENSLNFHTAGYEAPCFSEREHKPRLLDHILFNESGNELNVLGDQVLDPQYQTKKKGTCHMSDHKPRLMKFELK